jgi:predicted dehydrogenase
MDRRYFLLSSAAAAGAAFAQDTQERVRTAFIGTGNRGSYLLEGVLAQPNTKVVALCDIKPDRLDKAATKAARDNPSTTSDWHQIIDNKDVDAVFIATPPYLHSEMAIAAIKAGKHVYCEKPIGITVPTIRDLVKASKASNKVFVPGQQMRSIGQYKEAIQKIRDGAIGDVIMVKAQRNSDADLPHDGPSGDWYFDDAKSGGYLVEMDVHNLDLCNWVIGSHPSRCSGFGGVGLYKNDPPGRTIMDHVNLEYEYDNGARLSFTQNVFHPRGLPSGGQYVYVYGTKGAVDLMGSGNFYPLDRKAQPVQLAVKQQGESQHAHITAFYESITKGAKPPADITIGATAALTAVMGHEAATRRKIVEWREFGIDL